ncbi:hypothetical protein [Rubripirellula lacrimiformis]|uniref:hypothetical protein n=1 Tax=Rubripirellula lacrimiformis TaxID=1930273 RepID=UPI001C54DAF1|nr:hypothetical protein [Rubripirellula lacrimiformis]
MTKAQELAAVLFCILINALSANPSTHTYADAKLLDTATAVESLPTLPIADDETGAVDGPKTRERFGSRPNRKNRGNESGNTPRERMHLWMHLTPSKQVK